MCLLFLFVSAGDEGPLVVSVALDAAFVRGDPADVAVGVIAVFADRGKEAAVGVHEDVDNADEDVVLVIVIGALYGLAAVLEAHTGDAAVLEVAGPGLADTAVIVYISAVDLVAPVVVLPEELLPEVLVPAVAVLCGFWVAVDEELAVAEGTADGGAAV